MNGTVWFGWEEATMHFNESRVSGWITQPVNTWTNLAYLLAGGIILFRFIAEKRRDTTLLVPVSAIMVGISSFLYHASSTFFFQVFDLSSMFLLSSFLVTRNLKRLKIIVERQFYPIYFLITALSIGILLIVRQKSGEYLFAVLIIASIIMELILFLRAKTKRGYADYFLALGIFAAAYAVWLLDINHLFFNPESHILQGHALWHIINSTCYLFIFRFYSRFEKMEEPPAAPQ